MRKFNRRELHMSNILEKITESNKTIREYSDIIPDIAIILGTG